MPQPPDARSTDIIGRRARADVELERHHAEWHVRHGNDDGYHRGIADAVRWALGEQTTAPVSGRFTPDPPDLAALRAEDDAAYRAIYRERPNSYQTGVQAALMWVRGETRQRAALGIPDDG